MRTLIVAVMASFAAACGAARAPVATFEALPSRLAEGKMVIVDNVAGQQYRGRLVRLGADLIAFEDSGVERRLASADVRRVYASCDSLTNGAAIGLGVGVLAGVLTRGRPSDVLVGSDDEVTSAAGQRHVNATAVGELQHQVVHTGEDGGLREAGNVHRALQGTAGGRPGGVIRPSVQPVGDVAQLCVPGAQRTDALPDLYPVPGHARMLLRQRVRP
ncbi:MAG: hypothetical protein AB7Q16_08955 [Vicinamibacterales bacterium]